MSHAMVDRPSTAASSVIDGDAGPPLLYADESFRAPSYRSMPSNTDYSKTSVQETTIVAEPEQASYPVDKPTQGDIHEIIGLLKVKTSMLAMGACERIRKLSKAHPHDICTSPILPEMIKILEDGPLMPLAGAVLSALATLALNPEGRQCIVLLGGAPPLVKLVQRCDLTRPNTARGVQLLMNLAADSQNRKILREAGACEALVSLMKMAPLDSVMEQAMGALHNVMLTDSKAKMRAVEAGVAYGLARVLAAKLDENNVLAIRSRMLLADLLRIPDIQQRIVEAAHEQQLRIPGMMPASKRGSTTSGGRASTLGEQLLSARGSGPAHTLPDGQQAVAAAEGGEAGAMPPIAEASNA